jgi:hypothetical protein
MSTGCRNTIQISGLGNQQGSSVLLCLVVAGLGMFFVMTSLQSQADQSYKVFKIGRLIKQDAKALRSTLSLILYSPNGCKANLGNLIIEPDSSVGISQIHYGDGAGGAGDLFLDISSTTKNRYGKKVITRMNLSAHPTKFGAAGAGNHLTLLNVLFDDDRQIKIPIYVTTDASGKISICHATNFIDSDPTGAERTLEEKYCSSSTTPNQTSSWKTGDCMDCLAGSDPFYYCVTCKKQGGVYDPSTHTCL